MEELEDEDEKMFEKKNFEDLCIQMATELHFTPLMYNILENKIEEKNLKCINATNSDHWTALMIASRYSKMMCSNNLVEKLLKHGADPNIQSKLGWTALMFATSHTNRDSTEETVEILLVNGAKINIQEGEGLTALMIAVKKSITTSTERTVEML